VARAALLARATDSSLMYASSQSGHEDANLAIRRSRLAASFLVMCAAVTIAMVALSPGESARPAAHSSFAVLEGTASAEDGLPREVSSSLSASSEPEFTPTELRQARRVLADQPTWLVPAQEGELCVVQLAYPLDGKLQDGVFAPTVMQNCVPEPSAQAGQLVQVQTLGTSVATSKRSRVVGVVPNGVAVVHVETSDGGSATAAVNRNTYEVVVDEPTKAWFAIDLGTHEARETVTLPSFRPKSASPYVSPSGAT